MGLQTEVAGKIMVALDYPSEQEANELLQSLRGIPCYMKVGMQLFYAAGPKFVERLKGEGYKVFLDLKLHDIPNTVKGAAASISRLGVDMFNVHAAGGTRMMEAALEGAEMASAGARPVVIAVTQLTSTDERMLKEELGIGATMEETVVRYARLAGKAGLDGVVASPLEVVRIKEAMGKPFLTITPGIRPRHAAAGDQSRVMTPAEALNTGTDYMVIGRPITAQADPRQALESIIEELI